MFVIFHHYKQNVSFICTEHCGKQHQLHSTRWSCFSTDPYRPLTDHLYPPYFVHEQCRDDVTWQHGQAAQEADQIDQEIIVLLEVQVAAFLLLQKRAVYEPAVDEFVFVEICKRKRQSLDPALLMSFHTARSQDQNQLKGLRDASH